MGLVIPIQIPNKVEIDQESYSDTYAKITISPLEPGYGITIGNTIRRVLLSSIQGVALKFVRIEGLHHEFVTIPGTDTDYIDYILKLKKLVIISDKLEDIKLDLDVSKKGIVTAGDINVPNGVEIVNKDLPLFEITQDTQVRSEMILGVDRGYIPSEEHDRGDLPIDFIPIDSLFTPIKNVSFSVKNERVGKKVDFDKLIVKITTDGSVDPKESFYLTGKLLRDFYDTMVLFEKEPEYVEKVEMDSRLNKIDKLLNTSVNELELSVRSSNCLLAAKIQIIRDLVGKTENQMLKYRNFGKKSLDEIKDLLANYELSLGMNLDKIESEIEKAKNIVLKR